MLYDVHMSIDTVGGRTLHESVRRAFEDKWVFRRIQADSPEQASLIAREESKYPVNYILSVTPVEPKESVL